MREKGLQEAKLFSGLVYFNTGHNLNNSTYKRDGRENTKLYTDFLKAFCRMDQIMDVENIKVKIQEPDRNRQILKCG